MIVLLEDTFLYSLKPSWKVHCHLYFLHEYMALKFFKNPSSDLYTTFYGQHWYFESIPDIFRAPETFFDTLGPQNSKFFTPEALFLSIFGIL